MKPFHLLRSLTLTLAVLACSTAAAHFPWLDVDDQGHPILFFGEDLTERTYPLPASLQKFALRHAPAQGAHTSLATEPVDSDALVGLRASEKSPAGGTLYGSQRYGIYHGSKLVYYAQHLRQLDSQRGTRLTQQDAALRASITPQPQGIEIEVHWMEKPLAAVEVKLCDEQGQEAGSRSTDEEGRVAFSNSQLKPGLNAVLVGFTDKTAGTLGEQPYDASMHYLTVTFAWPAQAATEPTATTEPKEATVNPPNNHADADFSGITIKPSGLPELPAELTSFGGAVAGGKLFLYGGHTGSAHSYSTAEQSNAFWCLDLDQPAQWQTLPPGPRLQGLAMVADGDAVIRIGGFTALNAEGEPQDLRSQSTVSRFDPANKRWSDLPPLPEPRSSLGATIIGDQLFVAGGWSLQGEDSTWHPTAWKLDLKKNPSQWQAIAAPGFQRRAIAVAQHRGLVYVIGGMDQHDGPSSRTDIYDPQTDRWARGPDLPGEPMNGFGCAAHALDGRLFVSTIHGDLLELSADATEWKKVAAIEPGRFFHCMLPADAHSLLLVGGANMAIGKFTQLDRIRVK